MIDTHCHLTDPRLHEQLDAVIARADAVGVSRMITIGTTLVDDDRALRICEAHSNVRCAIGVHPGNCAEEADDFAIRLAELAGAPSVVALGEMGLDYHYQPFDKPRQFRFFRSQLQLAATLNLPVVIHNREATDDTLAILEDFPNVRGVFHCFTGSVAEARKIIDQGYWLGFTGVVTFKKSEEVRDACRFTPDDRLLLETDAPWLSPDPVRSQKSIEPAFVMDTARRVAEIRGTSIEALDALTTNNIQSLFGWP